jgi:hypothetical protein
MRLHWFSRAEDRLDAWVTRQHQERVLDGRTAPDGPCPNEAFLEGVAKQSRQITLSDPRVDHAANCPVCMRRLLELRSQYQSRRRRLVFSAAVGCCLLIVAAFVVVGWHETNTPRRPTTWLQFLRPSTYRMLGRFGAFHPTQPNPVRCNLCRCRQHWSR